jgi:hypothetical protein
MIYKDFVAEAAQKIMAAAISHLSAEDLNNDNEELGKYAKGCVNAAKALADALEEDWNEQPTDGGVKRFNENETFFDNYVNWSKTK